MPFNRILEFLSLNKEVRTAKKTIRELQPRKIQNVDSSGMFLIEAFQTPSNRLALSIFAPIAAGFYKSRIVAYYMMPGNWFTKLKERFRFIFSVEKCFGCEEIRLFLFKKDSNYFERSKQLIAQVQNLREMEQLSYLGIRVGDLIYDVYLRRTRKPTVDLSDKELTKITAEFLAYFDQLFDLFKSGLVSGVCVSHTVYTLGLPSRMAAHFNIPAFQITAENAYRITDKWSHAYTAFKSYPEIYMNLHEDLREIGEKYSHQRLSRRFNGEVGIDMHYSTASAFTQESPDNHILTNSSKPKILVAIHDFFDSPHSYGDNLFPDFYQWLIELGEISKLTDYEWYIKTHPDVKADGNEILKNFTKEFLNFNLIPSRTSHHQLITEGISVALTIFGSIAMEYPYLGIPVINASVNNPHTRYNFSFSPATVTDYRNLLLNLPDKFGESKRREIAQFYTMHHIYMMKSLIFYDYDLYFESVGGSKHAYGWNIFEHYSKCRNIIPIEEVRSAMLNFIISGDQFLHRDHFSQNSSVTMRNFLSSQSPERSVYSESD